MNRNIQGHLKIPFFQAGIQNSQHKRNAEKTGYRRFQQEWQSA